MREAFRTLVGVLRSLRIYYGNRAPRHAMDTLYRRFLRPGDLAFDIGSHVGDRIASFRRLGARVIACASSDDKLAFAKRHGADEGVNYASEDLRDGLKRLGGEHGIDVVYDPVGGRFAEAALRSLARLAYEVPPRILITGSLYLAGHVLSANGTAPR